ncbi:MAG: hypothetical protein GC162_02970 [Planctomycetes bacterium]|nr:hypothetical protein [Planctomycetota bacterium]
MGSIGLFVFLLLVLIAELAYFITQRKKLPAQSSYTKTNDGQWTRFEVTPGRGSINGAAIFPIVGGGLVLMVFPWVWVQFVGFLVAALGLWMTLRDARPAMHRHAMQFRVSPDAIESNGRTFKSDDLHRLIIKNAIDTDYEIAITSNSKANIQAVDRMNDRIRASKMAFSVNAEEGGKSYELAGGLNDTTANGLMTDVARLMNLTESA